MQPLVVPVQVPVLVLVLAVLAVLMGVVLNMYFLPGINVRLLVVWRYLSMVAIIHSSCVCLGM